MKMFEYMAAGRAIVTSDLPVIREVLNEKNAVFCEPDEIGDWKLKVESLLGNQARRNELGKQAWSDVKRYSWIERGRKIVEGFVE